MLECLFSCQAIHNNNLSSQKSKNGKQKTIHFPCKLATKKAQAAAAAGEEE